MPLASRTASLRVCIRTDASPFGFGAILFIHGWPEAWIAQEWSEADLSLLHAARGDPAWQAEWELFVLLISVDVWLPHLHGQCLCLFQSDATAALHSAARMAGRTPIMNALAAEMALRLESAAVTMIPEHLSGSLNFERDALSRMAQGLSIPASLQVVRRDQPRSRSSAFFWAWPQTLIAQSSSAVRQGVCGQGASGNRERHSQPSAQPTLLPSSRESRKEEGNEEAGAMNLQVVDRREAHKGQFQ